MRSNARTRRRQLSLGVVALAGIGAACDTVMTSPETRRPDGPGFGPELTTTGPASGGRLLASTNRGELVEIDLQTETVALIGDAGVFAGRDVGWTDIALSPTGVLFAMSNQRQQPDFCPGVYGGQCAHLYTIDQSDGSVIAEIGTTGGAFLSDITFSGGILYGAKYIDDEVTGDGALIEIDPSDASFTIVGDFGPALDGEDLEYGGLARHPSTGELWGVENDFSLATSGSGTFIRFPYLFRIDAATGAATAVGTTGQSGSPTEFAFSGLEILPDGRYFATTGGGQNPNKLYEIDPTPDAGTGLVEATEVALTFDAAIEGAINGLQYVETALEVEIDIKPGSDPNCFNNNGHGVIPVAIFGSSTLAAADIDPATVELEGLQVAARGKSNKLLAHIEDSNGDGIDDLVVQIEDIDHWFDSGNGTAVLTGNLFDGTPIVGSDDICIVPGS